MVVLLSLFCKAYLSRTFLHPRSQTPQMCTFFFWILSLSKSYKFERNSFGVKSFSCFQCGGKVEEWNLFSVMSINHSCCLSLFLIDNGGGSCHWFINSMQDPAEDKTQTSFEDMSHAYGKLENDDEKFLAECGMSQWGYWRGGSPE